MVIDRVTAACRITSVTEAGNLTTTYAYDAVNDLTNVCQAVVSGNCGQSRTFAYDSLARLITATNPESGATAYTYDNDGNRLTKTDANTDKTTMTYDALNRVASQAYTFISGYSTPNVTYCYDGNTQAACTYAPSGSESNLIGHLSLVSSSASSTAYGQYSVLGNIMQSTQSTGPDSYPFSYTYNLANAMTQMTLPSGRAVTWSYDSANRISSAGGTPPGGTTKSYASAISYAAQGPISQFTLGNGLVEVRSYDTYRQQPIGATLGVNNSDSSRLGLGFNYCASGAYYCTNNNGNLQSQTIGLLGASQTYGYDGYNRLSTSTEKTSATTNWSENFNYDSFGNRWVLPNPVGISLSAWTVTANYYNSSTNRLTFNNFGYDNAGNQTTISPYAVSYDVENRQTGFTSTSNGSATYTYDGDGRRVTKTTGGVTTTYVYDAGGDLAAEYSSQPPSMPCQTCYLTADHLGSTRVITDQNGNAVSRHDFLPFGEELVTSNRTAALDYGVADNVMHRYTGQQRDLEGPGLDFFRARYFHGAQGRFTSPDPSIPFSLKKDRFQAWIWNPQHWNKYAYALNNPFLYVDPSGMVETIYYWLNSSLTDEQKQFFQDHKTEILDAIAATLKQAGTGSVVFKDGGALSESQVENILETQPKGVAFINIANKSYAGQAAPSDMFGATQGIRSVVFVGNLQADNPTAHELILRIGQVADHELGHGMGFFSRGESTSFIMFWNRDLMNEGQGMPSSSSPRKFDMSIPQNRQAVDEINKLPEYKPQ